MIVAASGTWCDHRGALSASRQQVPGGPWHWRSALSTSTALTRTSIPNQSRQPEMQRRLMPTGAKMRCGREAAVDGHRRDPPPLAEADFHPVPADTTIHTVPQPLPPTSTTPNNKTSIRHIKLNTNCS